MLELVLFVASILQVRQKDHHLTIRSLFNKSLVNVMKVKIFTNFFLNSFYQVLYI